MKIISLLPALLFFSFPPEIIAQEQEKPSSITLAFNQDNAFGFYPAVFGSFGVSEQSSVTFYSLFWTNASFGTPATVSDLWTETGLGWSWNLLDGRWLINPTLGITNGKLLSGGAQGVIGDGIVPGLTSFYLDDRFEMEIFGAYYKALRREGPVTADYALFKILFRRFSGRVVQASAHGRGRSCRIVHLGWRIRQGNREGNLVAPFFRRVKFPRRFRFFPGVLQAQPGDAFWYHFFLKSPLFQASKKFFQAMGLKIFIGGVCPI